MIVQQSHKFPESSIAMLLVVVCMCCSREAGALLHTGVTQKFHPRFNWKNVVESMNTPDIICL